jgi:glycosyltransferase involved in cell wall biosynthesis
MVNLGIGIEALGPNLSGIGRYTKELCLGMAAHPEVCNLGFFRTDRWYARPDHFLTSNKPPRPQPRLLRLLRRPLVLGGFAGRLFHGPNYFVPPQVERSVITVHDLSVLRFPELHHIARRRDFERNFARSLDQANHIITDSWFIKREIEEFLGVAANRVTAIPLGVNPVFFAPRNVESDRRILAQLGLAERRFALCVATLEPRKGLDKALRAFRTAREREPGLPCDCLVIAGAAGWEDDALRAVLEPAVARGEVVLPGYVAESQLLALYARAEVFLYPSAYEGFGLPPLEAMAMGTPAVVSSRASIPEVVGDCALLAEPDDIDAFAAAITRALTDSGWRQSASSAGKEHAKRFTWAHCIGETFAVYRQVLAQ